MRGLEHMITALASAQHGVVGRAQLVATGVRPSSVDRRLRSGRLRLLHRGVYLVGPLESRCTAAMAAAIACGGCAVVSHRTAAELWELLPARETGAPIDVSLPSGHRRRPGIQLHRPADLRDVERTQLERVPITTPARTLLDLAATVSRRDLERALGEAFARRHATRVELTALIGRHGRHPGARALGELLQAGDPAFTRSEAELRFLELVRRAQLPAPETNVRVSGYEVDFYWRTQRFVVEVDGFAAHATAARFESDRRRDAVLAAAGIRVVRATWRQLEREPEALLVRLALALARANPF